MMDPNEKLLKTWIREALTAHAQDTKLSVFEHVGYHIERYTSESVHSIQEFRRRTTRAKGLLFEILCKLILQVKYETAQVWLLNEVPQHIRETLEIRSHDMGIDIIVFFPGGTTKINNRVVKKDQYYAVQCKYKRLDAHGFVPGTKYVRRDKVNWKEIATFEALCRTTGPYARQIVMTTATGVRRIGRKSAKDLSYCKKWFDNIDWEVWCNIVAEKEIDKDQVEVEVDAEFIRSQRLLKFSSN